MITVEEHDDEMRRPLGLTLLAGLYLFFFILSASTFGHPFPLLGHIYTGFAAKALVLSDSLVCLYLFMGVFKRQLLTWYFLIGYNLFQIVNTIINLSYISTSELEKVVGEKVNQEALIINNIAAALAIMLLTQYIYRHRDLFTNRQKYLF
ncbi:hypothetical protein [Geobacter sp. AOG1]|uniref:hypothetical protein n=1 Tax=Geobacter sp. AOG1 TaxID=1566346 RepID=UPI001CC823DB|nr:hypothetical protein [Geobacter sp. AOG1]GFE58212.1 hypothetical protein AOG1_20920 [Geobacter sp. AOG1]